MASLRAHDEVEPATFARLRAAVQPQHTLHDVIIWMAAEGGRPQIEHVVEQDEFTNDVVIRESEGVVLVYDCT